MQAVPPKVVGGEVRRAVFRWTWRTAARNIPKAPQCSRGADAAAATGDPTVADAAVSGCRSDVVFARGARMDDPVVPGADASTPDAEEWLQHQDVFLEGVQYLLRGPFRHKTWLQDSLISIVSGAIPTQAQVRQLKIHRNELPVDAPSHCPVCLQSTAAGYGHMWWECDLTQSWRHQYTLPAWLVPVPDGVGTLWAQRALAFSPVQRCRLAPAMKEAKVVCAMRPADGLLTGSVCTDGSGVYMQRNETARAGWGLSSVCAATARVTGAVHGPLPLFTQSVGNAEIYAAAMALRMAVPPIELASDYQHFIDGWEQGSGAYTQDGSRCGEAWMLFWAAAEDFGLQHITVRKVAAHLPFSAVREGRVSLQDWTGNHRADLEAKRGAALHPHNSSQVKAADDLKYAQMEVGRYIALLNHYIHSKGWHRHWHDEHLQPERHASSEPRLGADASGGDSLRSNEPCLGADASGGDSLRSNDPRVHCHLVVADAAAGLYRAVPRDGVADAARPRMADAVTFESRGRSNMGFQDPQCPAVGVVGADALAASPEIRFHGSHVVFRTEGFYFCARCGSYCGTTTRRGSALLTECLGAPPTLHRLRVRDRLMKGVEPTRPLRHTGCVASPLL